MIANYHTHTWRCNHAESNERNYVEAALKAGLKTLGFSDHGPYIFPGDYYSGFRMRLEQLEDYTETLLGLRQEYAGRIQIPIGLELEYYPELFPKLLPVLRSYPIDYLLLGQHFIGNEINAPYAVAATTDKSILIRYCDQTIDAMQTGCYTYFAHPDAVHYCGDEAFYVQHVRRICQEARSCGIPLELNLLGLRKGRHYPNPRFWETAAEEGCTVVLGRDAHSAKALLDAQTEARALEMIHRLGLTLTETVEFRKI